MTGLAGVKVIFAMSGSIACTALPLELKILGREAPPAARVIMSPQAARLMSPSDLQRDTGYPVYVDWLDVDDSQVPHIDLARWADVIVLMPATANTVSKLAMGCADNLLTTVILAATCPVVVAPAMNPSMLAKPAVQRNLARLRDDGFHIVDRGPDGDSAMNGALADLGTVLREARSALEMRS